MGRNSADVAVARIRTWASLQLAKELGDGELLCAYSSEHDQTAFEVLVKRHGPLVFATCERVLHHNQDAEDAFQAVFIVLAKKAASLHKHRSLASWLHQVGRQVALAARRAAIRRRKHESEAKIMEPANPAWRAAWSEVQLLLDQEIQRLPEKYREPFVLCCLENISCAQAARRLGVKEGTVWSRLAEARRRLQSKLTKRGVAISAVTCAVAIAPGRAAASLPPGLAASVVEAVTAVKGGGIAANLLSKQVAALVRSALSGLLLAKVKVGLMLALAVSALAGAAGWCASDQVAFSKRAAEPEAKAKANTEKNRERDSQRPRLDALGDPLPEGALARIGTVRFQHPGGINDVALSPDGKTLATHGARMIWVWDTATGKPKHSFPISMRMAAYSAAENLLAFAPDGRRLFYIHDDGVSALNLADWQPEVITTVGANPLIANLNQITHGIHVAPDGLRIAVSLEDGARVQQLASGNLAWNAPCDPPPPSPGPGPPKDRLLWRLPYSLALFSHNGKLVGVNASDTPDTLRMLDAISGEERQRIALGARLVRFVFSPDDRLIAVTERDNAVRVYETATGRRLHSWTVKLTDPNENYTSGVAFSPDGSVLAAGATDGLVHLWALQTGRELAPLKGHRWHVTGLVFAPEGHWLFSTGWDGVIRRWNTTTWKEAPVNSMAAGGTCAMSPAGSVAAWEEDRGVLHLDDVRTGKKLHTLPGNPAGYSKMAFSPDGSMLAAGGNDLSMQLWEVSGGKLLHQWSWAKGKDNPHASVDDIAFSADGKTLTTADFRRGEIVLWEATSGTRLGRAPHEMAFGVVYGPDGKSVLSVGWDKTVRWWSLPDLRPLDTASLPAGVGEGRFHAIARSPDGQHFATLDLGGFITIWDDVTHKSLHTFPAAKGQCNLAFSPDGQWLSTGGYEGDVGVWDVHIGKRGFMLAGHRARVYCVSFAADGRSLLTGSDDNTCLLWDLHSMTNSKDR